MWTNRPPIQKVASLPGGYATTPTSALGPLFAREATALPLITPLHVLALPAGLASSRCSSAGSTPGGVGDMVGGEALSLGDGSSSALASHPATPGAELVEMVRRMSWDSGDASSLGCLDGMGLRPALGADVAMDEPLPAPALLTTQPPSPVLAAIVANAARSAEVHRGATTLYDIEDSSVDATPSTPTSLHRLRGALLPSGGSGGPIGSGHRKAASCPFQLSEFNGVALMEPTSSPTSGGSPRSAASLERERERERSHERGSSGGSGGAMGSLSGKWLHSPSTHHSHHGGLFHPYARDRSVERDRDTRERERDAAAFPPPPPSSTLISFATPLLPMTTPMVSPTPPTPQPSPPPHAITQQLPHPSPSQHRPTVISPASRFLSRNLSSNLAAHAALSFAAMPSAAASASASASASPPSHSPTHTAGQGPFTLRGPPPLSLSVMSQLEHHGVGVHSHSAHTNQQMNQQTHHLHSHSHGLPNGYSLHSPAHGHGYSLSSTAEWVISPPASPSVSVGNPSPRFGASFNGVPSPAGSSSSGGGAAGTFRTPNSSPASRPFNAHHARAQSYAPCSPLLGDHPHGAAASAAAVSSATLSLMGLPMGAAPRSSSAATSGSSSPYASPSPHGCHSPLIRPDFSAFDGAAPGGGPMGGWHKLSSHSPAKHRSLPGTPLHKPHHAYSVPPTPNARLAKQARSRRPSNERNLLDAPALLIDYTSLHTPITNLPLMSSLPTNPSWLEMVYAQDELGMGSWGEVFRVACTSATPFASQLHQFLTSPASYVTSAPPSPFLLATNTIVPSPPSTAATTTNGSPSSATPPTFPFAWKRTKTPFASIHERGRMLRKYTHVYELLQKIKAQGQSGDLGVGGGELGSFIDPVTFHPLHLVRQTHVWQENNKLNVLMELCSRGDLTIYWNQPTEAELKQLKDDLVDEYSYDSKFDDVDENMASSAFEVPFDDLPRPPLSPLSETIAWRLLLEIGSCLALMHQHAFYHLDVKPGNIFVTNDEVFKLGDMDSCTMLTHQPTPGVHSIELDNLDEGDGMWCAPELLATMQNVSPACDIYSLGASVYAVLNDQIPMTDHAAGETLLSFASLKCAISTQLRDTLVQMTSHTPAHRPTAKDLMHRARSMIAQPVLIQELKLTWTK